MKCLFQLCLCAAGLMMLTRGGRLSADEISARIETLQRIGNLVEIGFSVTGEPDRAYVEGSSSPEGPFRVDSSARLTNFAPSAFRASLPVAADKRFFRVLLVAETVTNTLVVPKEAESSFGSGSTGAEFQQVYAANEFFDEISDLIEITGLAFRLNETTSDFDAWANATLEVGLFHGSMHDVPRDSLVPTSNTMQVFNEDSIRLTAASPTSPDTFEIYFRFTAPYVYDRTLGQLVLQASFATSHGPSLDAVAVSWERGWMVFRETLGRPNTGPGLVVTRFEYVGLSEAGDSQARR